MSDVFVATGIMVANAASDSSSYLDIDYASIFEPIKDSAYDCITAMLPVLISLFAIPFVIDVVIYVVKLVVKRKEAEKQAYFDELAEEMEENNMWIAAYAEDPEWADIEYRYTRGESSLSDEEMENLIDIGVGEEDEE